ncbi:hypothetical protein KP17_00340 [Pectobacterium parvum]|nr:hypothetical protein KP17_00340 [Pectobacterium parvum]KHS94555.1 hypothetical protein RC88_12515 [Pectobacterium parvum]
MIEMSGQKNRLPMGYFMQDETKTSTQFIDFIKLVEKVRNSPSSVARLQFSRLVRSAAPASLRLAVAMMPTFTAC